MRHGGELVSKATAVEAKVGMIGDWRTHASVVLRAFGRAVWGRSDEARVALDVGMARG